MYLFQHSPLCIADASCLVTYIFLPASLETGPTWHNGVLWKHYLTAKVFSIGAQTCGFLTKVPLHVVWDDYNSSTCHTNPCALWPLYRGKIYVLAICCQDLDCMPDRICWCIRATPEMVPLYASRWSSVKWVNFLVILNINGADP